MREKLDSLLVNPYCFCKYHPLSSYINYYADDMKIFLVLYGETYLYTMITQAAKKPILIILIAGIGDLVLASRALRAIKNEHPNQPLYILTSSEAAPLAKNYAYVDKVISFPIRELRRQKGMLFSILRLLFDIRRTSFESIVNLYPVCSVGGALKMGLIFLLLKASNKIGHDSKGFGLFVNKKIPRNAFAGVHYADAFLNVAKMVGAQADGRGIDVFYDATCKDRWNHFFGAAARSNREPIVCISPGGDRANRQWAPSRFGTVANMLAKKFGARLFILGGPKDIVIAQAVSNEIDPVHSNLAGRMSLDDLVYIISQADVLITNDSAPMHIAAALGVRQVTVFGPEDPALFHPYAHPDTYTVIQCNPGCSPCKDNACRHISCLDMVTVEMVYTAACKFLSPLPGAEKGLNNEA
jgi:lipopolysaccharide heptosyltransferase II